MRIFFAILFLVSVSAQEIVKAHSKADIGWTHEFPEGVSQFILRAYAGTNSATVASSLAVPSINGLFSVPLLSLMGASTNGVYTVKCFAQDFAGEESEPSNSL